MWRDLHHCELVEQLKISHLTERVQKQQRKTITLYEPEPESYDALIMNLAEFPHLYPSSNPTL
jgi:hypothetical protein